VLFFQRMCIEIVWNGEQTQIHSVDSVTIGVEYSYSIHKIHGVWKVEATIPDFKKKTSPTHTSNHHLSLLYTSPHQTTLASPTSGVLSMNLKYPWMDNRRLFELTHSQNTAEAFGGLQAIGTSPAIVIYTYFLNTLFQRICWILNRRKQ
jgi:hypothetical protein